LRLNDLSLSGLLPFKGRSQGLQQPDWQQAFGILGITNAYTDVNASTISFSILAFQ
jgi:hypothetical protein